MNVLIVGCGKVGSQISNQLSEAGHDVAVVDRDPEHFQRLSDDFSGYTVTGVPIDQDVLKRAGIEGCDVVAAVTEDDNTNVMVCQVANDVFHVPWSLARVYDPRRSNVFAQFGLHTICPTNLSVDAILSMITTREPVSHVYFDAATASFETVPVAKAQAGLKIRQIQELDGADGVLFGVLHEDGNLTLAGAAPKYELLEKDRLIFARVVD